MNEYTCGLFGGGKIIISMNRCNSFTHTVIHEYSHYLNYFLLTLNNHKTQPNWWNEGLAVHVSQHCYNNTNYQGSQDLLRLLTSVKDPYRDGTISHGFLDSTPILNNYHNMILRKIQKNLDCNQLYRQIANKYGHRFKPGSFCRIYNKWLNIYSFFSL